MKDEHAPRGPKLAIIADDSGADGRVFRCPVAGCAYASPKRRYVGDHMRTHDKRDPNAKRFGCPYPGCTYSCTRVRYIGEHMRRHTGIKPHKCEHPGCTFTAAAKSHLTRHAAIHKVVKPYQVCFRRPFAPNPQSYSDLARSTFASSSPTL